MSKITFKRASGMRTPADLEVRHVLKRVRELLAEKQEQPERRFQPGQIYYLRDTETGAVSAFGTEFPDVGVILFSANGGKLWNEDLRQIRIIETSPPTVETVEGAPQATLITFEEHATAQKSLDRDAHGRARGEAKSVRRDAHGRRLADDNEITRDAFGRRRRPK